MKLIRKKTDTAAQEKLQAQPEQQASYQHEFYNSGISAWKVLIVDDEPDIHAITKLSLKNFKFADRKVEFLNAMSGAAAMEILRANPDIAAALIDVIMETEDTGLRLVRFIREELKNTAIRLIIRTGQPGAAPERYVIDHFDIDDYKEKTELVADKLYTTLRSAIKAYRDIGIIQRNRQGLEKILNAAPQLYRIQSMKEFFEGVLTQMTGFCHLGDNNLISTINGFIATADSEKVRIQIGTGRFAENISQDEVDNIIRAVFSPEEKNHNNSVLIPLKIHNKIRGFIFFENQKVPQSDMELIYIMANQCAAALENIKLYNELDHSNKLNEHKNRFLGMAAHDLRNPISGMKTIFELLRMSLSEQLSADDAELLDMGNILVDTAINLVSDLLDIAQIESGKSELEKRATDLSSVIMQSIAAVRFISESKHIPMLYEPAVMSDLMMLDPKRMQQVIVNLLSNAIKYSHPHTVVNITVEKSDKEVIIAVKDQGQGIPATDVGRLFQPFVKASVKSTGGEQSTGLGLVICKKVAEAHGGRIWVESQAGAGSTFFVAIPKENE